MNSMFTFGLYLWNQLHIVLIVNVVSDFIFPNTVFFFSLKKLFGGMGSFMFQSLQTLW